jgi:acetyl-CoA carboxylase carboxyl transferase subunit beta
VTAPPAFAGLQPAARERGSKIGSSVSEPRIDVRVENTAAAPAGEQKHPNTCPSCGSHYRDDELALGLYVCPHCGHHFPMPAWARVEWLTDRGSFIEEATDVRSEDPLRFFDLRPYAERLSEAELNTGLADAMVIGRGTIDDHPVELAVMDFSFMGGSMGSVVGEKFSRACDSAIDQGAPLIAVPSSGGARMQEGILSLMQLPKTVAAVEDLHDAGLAMLVVLAHPTTAGVLASFASLGDVTIAEPGALIAFTGPRVIQGTTREKLPDDFALAEQNLRFGHVDAIVPRHEQRPYLTRLLRLFA